LSQPSPQLSDPLARLKPRGDFLLFIFANLKESFIVAATGDELSRAALVHDWPETDNEKSNLHYFHLTARALFLILRWGRLFQSRRLVRMARRLWAAVNYSPDSILIQTPPIK
jgi:hypothetical protein